MVKKKMYAIYLIAKKKLLQSYGCSQQQQKVNEVFIVFIKVLAVYKLAEIFKDIQNIHHEY